MMFKSMNGLAPKYLQSLFSQRRSVYNLKDSEGKTDLTQTKYQLSETQPLLQRSYVME